MLEDRRCYARGPEVGSGRAGASYKGVDGKDREVELPGHLHGKMEGQGDG